MLIIQIIAVLTFKAPLRRRWYVEGNVTIIFLQLRNITFNHLRIYERHTGVLKLQQNPYKNSKSVQMSGKFWTKCDGLQRFLHCWDRRMAGPTGWVWKSADIPPIWDKENTDSRPAVDESQPQQMRLGAWQQPSPGTSEANPWPIIAGIQMTDGSGAQPC